MEAHGRNETLETYLKNGEVMMIQEMEKLVVIDPKMQSKGD